MVNVHHEYAARRFHVLGRDEEVRVVDETREIVWLDGPICKVQLTVLEVGKHSVIIVVDLVDEIVNVGSVSRPVVVTVR